MSDKPFIDISSPKKSNFDINNYSTLTPTKPTVTQVPKQVYFVDVMVSGDWEPRMLVITDTLIEQDRNGSVVREYDKDAIENIDLNSKLLKIRVVVVMDTNTTSTTTTKYRFHDLDEAVECTDYLYTLTKDNVFLSAILILEKECN